MAEILVLGAGLTGLTTAMLLARDGHDVTVLERDAADPPPGAEASWTGWDRAGVAQFRQLHLMLPRWREVMETELPGVLDALRAAGGLDHNMLHHRPAAQTGGWQPGDERFALVTARRPVLEAAVATAAASCPGLRIRRGVAVAGLLTADGGAVPRVVGVRTDSGDVRADLVVDAAGRRSAASRWIVDVEGRAPVDERADCGFVYYGRHYRGAMPAGVDSMLSHNDSVSLLTLPADNGTWGVGITTSSRDRALRALRHAPCWEAAAALLPGHRGMDRRRADHRDLGDGGHRGPAAAARRGLGAGGDRSGGRRRRLGQHQPVPGPRRLDRRPARLRAAGRRGQGGHGRPGHAGAAVRRGDRRDGRAVRGLDPVLRPAPAGRDRGGRRRRAVRAGRPIVGDHPRAGRRRARGPGGGPGAGRDRGRAGGTRAAAERSLGARAAWPATWAGRTTGPGADRAELLAAVRGAERSR